MPRRRRRSGPLAAFPGHHAEERHNAILGVGDNLRRMRQDLSRGHCVDALQKLLDSHYQLGRFWAHYQESLTPSQRPEKAERDHFTRLKKDTEEITTQVLFCLDRKNKGAW